MDRDVFCRDLYRLNGRPALAVRRGTPGLARWSAETVIHSNNASLKGNMTAES